MREIQEFSLDELKHLLSPRALTGETVLLNMGPQHPSTHGVLRVILELDGEIVVNAIPDIATCIPASKRTWNPRPTKKQRR